MLESALLSLLEERHLLVIHSLQLTNHSVWHLCYTFAQLQRDSYAAEVTPRIAVEKSIAGLGFTLLASDVGCIFES
jgi:hypothetical protein